MSTKSISAANRQVKAAVGYRIRRRRVPWMALALFLTPLLFFYLVFILYPLFATIWNSLHTIEYNMGTQTVTFVGLDNYLTMLDDRIFHTAMGNTIIWGVVGPTIEMLFSTALALLVFFRVPFYRFFRTAWFTPMLVSGVIVGLVFRWIFNNEWGLLNTALRSIGLDSLAVNWLGRRDTPLWVVIFVHFWATFGFSFVLILAGLSTIPNDLIEAARVDGAKVRQIIIRVILPMLRPTLITVTILSFMGKMKAFNVVWVLTGGGPLYASETVATYVQKRAFAWRTLDLGYPSAIAVFWFGVVLVGVLLLRYLLSRGRQKQEGVF